MNVEELKKEKARMFALIKDMSDAIILMNAKGKITLVNAKAVELFNIQIDEKKVDFESSHLESIIKKMRDVLSTLQPVSFQFQTSDSKPDYYNVFIRPLKFEGSLEAFAIISDITEIIKTHEMRSSILSKLSHELRTPVNNIKTSLKVLKKKIPDLDSSLDKFFTIIEKEIEHLRTNIDSLLDFSLCSSEQINLDWSSNNLNEIIKKEVNDYLLHFADKEISVTMKLPTTMPNSSFDREKIIKVIKNLLENAYKFTPVKGSVQIGAEFFRTFADIKNRYHIETDMPGKAQYALVYIKDSGTGIDKNELQKIFEPFYQSESIFEHKEGTGLGLYICKSIVQAHGGIIWAESNSGKSSLFYFALPLIGTGEEKTKSIFFKIRD